MIKKTVGAGLRRVLSPAGYQALCRGYDRSLRIVPLTTCPGFGRACPFCGMRLRHFLNDPGEPSPVFRVLPVAPAEQIVVARKPADARRAN